MEIKGDFADFKNIKEENVSENKIPESVNFNNLTENKDVKNVKVELNIDSEILKDIKKLNDNFYVDKYGIIREKIFYKIKKYICRTIIISGLSATFYYGILLPYYENPNFIENRKIASEKTNDLSMKFFDFKVFSDETEINDVNKPINNNNTNKPISEDKNKLINELTKEVKSNESKIIKTISINDETPKITKEVTENIKNNKHNIKEDKTNNISNSNEIKENKKEIPLIKTVEDIPKEIIEKEEIKDNSLDKSDIKKPVLSEKKPVIVEEDNNESSSTDAYKNNGNDFLNDETPISDEPNDTKIDETTEEPIFNEKSSVKKLMESTDIKESSEN